MSKKVITVVTVTGEELPKSNCRRIDGVFYKVGDPKVEGSGDCYKIGDRYYRDGTGYIVYDHLKNEYTINSGTIIKGIIGFSGGEPVMGHFTKSGAENVRVVISGKVIVALNKDVFDNIRKYRYHLDKDMFMHISDATASEFIQIPYLDMDEKYSLPYNCDPVIDSYKAAFEKAEFKISPDLEELSKELKDLSFGLEFETTNGKVPSRLTSPLGLIPLRDGSISGLEYATIPYQGVKGLTATKMACDALNTYTRYDDRCSLHLHMGGIPRTKEFLVALFKVLCYIQDEMFGLFPIYKKYNFGVKSKNYTKPLPSLELLGAMDKIVTPENINRNFDELFKFLSMGLSMDNYGHDLGSVLYHPSDPRGRSKWNIRTRYHWVNLIPIIFGNKKTVEFRIHTPTTDYNKILSYIFLCGGIVNYVKENTKEILEGKILKTLSDIMYTSYEGNSFLYKTLHSYITNRRNVTYGQVSKGDIKGNEEEIVCPDLFKELEKFKAKTGSSSSNYLSFADRMAEMERELSDSYVTIIPTPRGGRRIRTANPISSASPTTINTWLDAYTTMDAVAHPEIISDNNEESS